MSYTWGEPLDKTEITCDGGTIIVPNNLNDFLLRTRAKGNDRILWVDSISINQEDNLEKASQVMAMRHIYAKAKRALIWLGKEYDDSTLALETAKEFCAKFKSLMNENTSGDATNMNAASGAWFMRRVYNQLTTVWDPKWGAFFRLIDRPYFNRAWIVQEVVVSKEQWVICGEVAIPWLDLFYAIVHCATYEAWLLEFYGSLNFNNLMALQLSQNELYQKKQPLFYRVLLRHRMCISQDGRDKVFAYHGIASNNSLIEHNLKPDPIQHQTSTMSSHSAPFLISSSHRLPSIKP